MKEVLAVTLTVEQLADLVRKAVREELSTVKRASEASEILTRTQAAELLSVNAHQIPKLIKQGLPAHRFGPTKKQWRFRRSEVLEWIADGCSSSEAG